MKKIALLVTCIIIVITGCVTVKFTPPEPEYQPKITAWMAFWDWDRAMVTVRKNSDIISELMPFWYDMDSTGAIFDSDGIPDMRQKGLLKNMDQKKFVKYCHRNHIKVIPLISNEFKKQSVHAVLSNETIRWRHIENILTLVTTNNYDGVDIDYEGMMKQDRDPYSAFLKDLSERLHENGKLLSVAVHAKTSEPGNWDSNIAHDYAAIGKVADRVRIMAYDNHWSGGEPGPIAPVDWINDIVAFAVTVIPPEKIYLGFPIYGINWGKPKDGEAMYDDAMNLKKKYHATLNWDTTSLENWFTYTDETTFSNRTVWFSNGRSFNPRWNLVKLYHLGGVSFWRFGGEDPQMWRIIRSDRFIPSGHVKLYYSD